MINLVIIRDIARQKKISMREIARRVGVTEQGLQKIIRENSTKVETLEAIAQALDVPVSIFFNDSEAGANIISNPNAIAGHGNTVSGNHTNINVSLPEQGFQKIIRSDGSQTTVEVAHSDRRQIHECAEELEALRKENNDLKNKIIELQERLLKKQ